MHLVNKDTVLILCVDFRTRFFGNAYVYFFKLQLPNIKTLPQQELRQPIILWCTSGICTSEGGCDGQGGSQPEQDDKGNLESFI